MQTGILAEAALPDFEAVYQGAKNKKRSRFRDEKRSSAGSVKYLVGHEKTMQDGECVGEESFSAQSPPPFRTHLLYDTKGRSATCGHSWAFKC